MNERREISKEETVTIQRKEPSREEIADLAYGLYLQRTPRTWEGRRGLAQGRKRTETARCRRASENQGRPGRSRITNTPCVKRALW